MEKPRGASDAPDLARHKELLGPGQEIAWWQSPELGEYWGVGVADRPPEEELALQDAVDAGSQWAGLARRTAAASWVFHGGLSLFSYQARGEPVRPLRLVYAGVALRDVAVAVLWGRLRRPERLIPWVTVTDAAASVAISRRLPMDAFLIDRPMGQFGLSSAWSLLLSQPKSRIATVAAFPLGVQVFHCLLWRVPLRRALPYIGREFVWSLSGLWAIQGLRLELDAATEAEQRLLADERETQRLQAERINEVGAWQVLHERFHPFTAVRMRLEVLKSQHDDEASEGYDRVASLAQAEVERLRRGHEAVTVNALVARMIATRPPEDHSRWVDPLPNEQVIRLDAVPGAMDWLVDFAKAATGDLVVRTSLGSRTVEIVITAPHLPAVDLPDGWHTDAAQGLDVLVGRLTVSHGEHG